MTKKLRITHINITLLVTQKMNKTILIIKSYKNLSLKHLNHLHHKHQV